MEPLNKQQLRALLKDKRAALPRDQKKQWDRQIVQRIAASPEFQQATALLLYAPLPGEIDLLLLARIAREQGKAVAFPRCNTQACTLEFYQLTPDTRLIPGAYGIAEPPPNAPRLIPDRNSLCILPALSFDPNGNRLGYGKGYYDRFLATFPGIAAGAVYSSFLLKEIPTQPHDLPVSLLFTQRDRRDCEKSTDFPAKSSPWDRLITWGRAQADRLRPSRAVASANTPAASSGNPQTGRLTLSGLFHGALHKPPILVAAIFVLLLLSRLVEAGLDRSSEYAGVVLLQILIFLLPAILYGTLRGEGFSGRIRMRPPRPEHLWFILCTLVVMISGSLLTSILTGGIASLDGNFTLYSTFTAHYGGSAWEILSVLLAYALLPAFCEELVFRSLLCAEYEERGVAVAVTASGLFFAMLHFSFPHFLTYLLLGALLALAMYTTRSFFTALLLHLLYNVFCLFGQPYLSAFYVNAGSNQIFLFCLVVLFLLFAAFAAGEARKIYHIHAKNNADSSYTRVLPLKQYPRAMLTAVFTPATALCALLWLVFSILDLL